MKKKKLLFVILLIDLLVGCSFKNTVPRLPSPEKSDKEGVNSIVADSRDEGLKMERCRRELEALKKINGPVYQKRRQEFDHLMAGAGMYSGVRGDVSTYTQGAVDAYYRYRADKLCADIANDVLNNLSSGQ